MCTYLGGFARRGICGAWDERTEGNVFLTHYTRAFERERISNVAL